jgi:hypothetical protein
MNEADNKTMKRMDIGPETEDTAQEMIECYEFGAVFEAVVVAAGAGAGAAAAAAAGAVAAAAADAGAGVADLNEMFKRAGGGVGLGGLALLWRSRSARARVVS